MTDLLPVTFCSHLTVEANKARPATAYSLVEHERKLYGLCREKCLRWNDVTASWKRLAAELGVTVRQLTETQKRAVVRRLVARRIKDG